jgi:hypothetical protein
MIQDKNIVTNLTITPKDKGNLKIYFNSIKRNLPEKWIFCKNEIYNDTDTFKILNGFFCLQTPYLRNEKLNLTFFAKIFIGITDDEIFLIKINFNEKIELPDKIFAIDYILEMLKNEILVENKYYDQFNHKFEFGGPHDENFDQPDIRNERMIRIHSKLDNTSYALAKGNETKIGKQKIMFLTPNNISLTLSLMKKSYKKAFLLHKELIRSKTNKTIKLEEEHITILYDYFEEIISSVIFAYISVEAMSNAAIPEGFEIEKTNEKGIKETWTKENIERWMSTSQKTGEILPSILNSGDIKKEAFWVHFKDLEKLRNELIHQKTINSGTKLDSDIYKKLINPNVFVKIKSAISVIKYYYDLDNSHPYFPLGMGIAKFLIQHVESLTDYFGKLEEVK